MENIEDVYLSETTVKDIWNLFNSLKTLTKIPTEKMVLGLEKTNGGITIEITDLDFKLLYKKEKTNDSFLKELKPKKVFQKERLEELKTVIESNSNNDLDLPIEWIIEYNELIEATKK